MKTLLRLLCRVLFRVEIHGKANLQGAGAVLVIANHESFLDGLLLGLFLPVEPMFVVHTAVVKNPWFRLLLARVAHLAVDPTNPMAMKQVIKLWRRASPWSSFPEGRITITGSLMKVYDGPAFVAAKTGAPILPIRLDGPARSYFSRLSGNYPRSLFPRITLSILPTTHCHAGCPERQAAPPHGGRGDAPADAGNAVRLPPGANAVQCLSRCDRHPWPQHAPARGHAPDRVFLWTTAQDKPCTGQADQQVSTPGGKPRRVVAKPDQHHLPDVWHAARMRRVPAMLNYTAGTAGMQNACIAARVRTVLTSRRFVEQAKLADTLDRLQNVQVVYLEDLRSRFNV